jgi:hypothetical protein
MPSIINASTSGAGGVITTADASGQLELQTAGTTRQTIDVNGNVGIGTSSPASLGRFAVVGGAVVANGNGTTDPEYRLNGASGGVTRNYAMGTDSSQRLYWYDYTASAYRMLIDSSGNFLINTTDTTLFNNTSGNGVCYRVNSSLDIATSSDNCLILNRMTSTGPITEFRYAGTIVGTITVTGSATAYNTSSDYRLKENVAPMVGALETVAQLKPVTYNWKADGSNGQGFIAHELQEVVPDCVTGEKDAVDAEGNPVYQGIDTSFLVATLTAAIQELKARIEVLEGASA